MSLFRGYVEVSDDKRPLGKFKDGGKPFREVKDCRGYAGVLAQDTVLIDVDDEKWGEVLFEIVKQKDCQCQVRKTDRGYHFYFKNDGSFTKCATGVTLALGIKADIKVGVSTSIANLKLRGVMRPVVYDRYEDEPYEIVPRWLRIVHTNLNVLGLGDGDGRNDVMFKLVMPLQTAGLSTDDCRETLSLINEYIFAKPLSKSEFETVTRDEAFETTLVPNFFGEKGKFLFEQFGDYLIREHNIKRVNGQLHFFDGRVYTSGVRRIEKLMLDVVCDLSKRQRSEVMSYLDVMCTEDVDMADAKFCAFTNGVLDMDTLQLKPFDPSVVITNLIPWNYERDVYNATVDKMLTKVACGDKEIRALLEEAAGSLLYRRNELRKSFILTGGARGGKSSYINMLGQMLGESNMSALDLNDLSQGRFRIAELFGKLGNLGDDIGDNFIEDMSIFKKLVSGDKVVAERKGQDPFFFSNYAKFVFSANDLPRMRDKSSAALDRMIVIPFDATFSADDPDYDPFISDKLKEREAVEYLIKLGVDAFAKVRARKKFTESKKVQKELQEYSEENNPILTFLKEVNEEELMSQPHPAPHCRLERSAPPPPATAGTRS